MDTLPNAATDPPGDLGDGRAQRLQIALQELERRFGPWIVYRLKDARPVWRAQSISSGTLAVDHLIGVGGFPRGRIVELIGPASSGKSVLSYHLLANAQRQGGFAAFIDAAQRASFEQMARCGVNLTDLFLVVPESAYEALEIAALLAESGGLDALVIGPFAELIGASRFAAQATATKLGRLNAALRESPTVVACLTDAVRHPSAASVGRALRHFATLRISSTPLRPIVHPSGDVLGLRIRLETIKNKLAPPRRQAELDLRWDRGIHQEAELVDLGLARGMLDVQPLGICFGSALLGRGRARAIATLENDPTLAQALHTQLRQNLALNLHP